MGYMLIDIDVFGFERYCRYVVCERALKFVGQLNLNAFCKIIWMNK